MNIDKHKLGMSSGRLEALGDGIFSIAMTILVLEIALPAVNGDAWKDFSEAMHHVWYDLLCYAISFIVLGIMWYGHRLMFEYIGKTNRHFIFLGILFYMVVCLVPFSTRFLAKSPLQWYSTMIYGINLSLCNLTLFIQWRYGISKATMIHREIPLEVRKEATLLFLLSPAVYTVAIALSFVWPWASISIFIATPIFYLLPNKIDKYLP